MALIELEVLKNQQTLNFDDALNQFVVKEENKKDICFKFEALEEVRFNEATKNVFVKTVDNEIKLSCKNQDQMEGVYNNFRKMIENKGKPALDEDDLEIHLNI
jgi:hypothetical protein